MARDSRDAAEKEELRRRAQRYCPTLEGRAGQDLDDRDAPADTY